jgi:hypothetical protein
MEEIKEVQFAHPVAQHHVPSAAGKLTTPCATTC